MYKINVIVITYNQQDYIGRALDSILVQKDDGLNNIIVVDDCSTDNNWQVIQDYAVKYPSIIKAYRNEKNLGIMANMQRSHELKGNADLYCRCSGDDALCYGWFKAVQAYIIQHNIEKNESFFLIGGFKTIQPDGKEHVFRQQGILDKHIPLEMLFLRSIIHGRSTIQSKSLYDKYESVILDKGLNLSETHYDIQKFLHADKWYYVPFIGSIYYMRIGVAKTLSINHEKYDSYWIDGNIVKWEYFKDNVLTRQKDKFYAKYSICRLKYEKNGQVYDLWKAILYRFASIDIWADRFIPFLKDIYHTWLCHNRYVKKFTPRK